MEDFKHVFEKIEKAEAILSDLDKKWEEHSIEQQEYQKLSNEHQHKINNAWEKLADLKNRIAEELTEKTTELDSYQKELEVLQARLKVGEIIEQNYEHKSKLLLEKIQSLEKKVTELQNLVSELVSRDEQKETIPPTIDEKEKGLATNDNPPSSEKDGNIKVIGDDVKDKEVKENRNPEEVKPPKTAKSFHSHAAGIEQKGDTFFATLTKNKALSTIIAASALILLILGAAAIFMPKIGSSTGNIAPDFVVQINDETISSLNALKGKNVVLVFWDRDFWDDKFFSVDGIVRKLYLPDKLNEVYEKYAGEGLEIVAIASGTSNNEVDDLTSNYNIKFPVLVDSFGELRSEYNIKYEPTYIFIDRAGIIRARVEGPIYNTSTLEQLLYSIEKKEEIKPLNPPITGVLLQSISEKSANISWVTAQPTATQVMIDSKNIETVITPAPQTIHSVDLKDLLPDTSYIVRIIYNINDINVSPHSFNALSDTIVSRRYNITTSSTDMSDPEISSINIGLITDSSVTISWKTDEPTTGKVEYGIVKSSLSSEIEQPGKMTIWHSVKVNGLKSETQYYLKIKSKDAGGRESAQEIDPIITQGLISTAPEVDRRAPDFTLETLDGVRFSLSQFAGHKVLLVFWSETCAACKTQLPLWETVFNKYNRNQLTILAVNIHGDFNAVKQMNDNYKLTFPVFIDKDGTVDNLYKSPSFPTALFIDSNGIIRHIHNERFNTVSEIDAILDKLN